ncbi:MAG: adenine deaminase [Eubacteriales bacterium]|nr:adenine deaminase [Eubacteriales bacterium]
MEKEELRKRIRVAHGDDKADLVIKNASVVNVFTGEIQKADIAISGNTIAGIGSYEGEKEVDATGKYAIPGLIDSHIHIESSYLSPEELGKMLVPHGTSTILADPHEIVNVCGIKGLDYMMRAAKNTKLDIKFLLPSCVPATPFEHSGAVVDAKAMEETIQRDNILGLAEFMNYPGVISASDDSLDKIMVAKKAGKIVDGHAPSVHGKDLMAYCSARINGDHESSTAEDMLEKMRLGMYCLVRKGSACHDLRALAKAINETNERRCLLCSDDRQPATILKLGHIDYLMKMLVEEGVPAITAIRMATLNPSEAYHLTDRGALAPGYRADIVLVDNLVDFKVEEVYLNGEKVAEKGNYLPKFKKEDITPVLDSIHLKDFSKEKFKMHLKSNHVNVITIQPGGVLTKKEDAYIQTKDGEFVFYPNVDLVKVAVVERHQMTGNVAAGILKGYGIKRGAIALSVAHDSHNIIVVGVNDEEMETTVKAVQDINGGFVVALDGKVIGSMPLPIAGLMSDQSGEWVANKLVELHNLAYDKLGVSRKVEPFMTLCFMSLLVIPEIKLSDEGLFDVTKFSFIPLEIKDEK